MDIVERLRKRRIPIRYGDWTDYEDDTQCHEAATEIERLREALQKIADAKIPGVIDDGYDIMGWILKHRTILVDKARKALGEKE